MKDVTGVIGMETYSIIYIHFSQFSSLSHSHIMTFRHGHQPCWLRAQGNQHNRDLICLVAPVSLDLSTWPSIRKCWLRLSRPSSVTSVGALATFSLPMSTLWLQLRTMNMLLFFPGRVRVSRSNGTASWMPWYSRRMMVRVTYLTWFLMMRVTWIFSSMKAEDLFLKDGNIPDLSSTKNVEFKIVQTIIKRQLEGGETNKWKNLSIRV